MSLCHSSFKRACLFGRDVKCDLGNFRDFRKSAFGSVYIKHLKVKGTRNYYFKTIGYCFRTKVKSPLILRRPYATWRWASNLYEAADLQKGLML